jgi:hypothetical protein
MINLYPHPLLPGDPLRLLDAQLQQPSLPLVIYSQVFLLGPRPAESPAERLARVQRHVVSVSANDHRLHVGFIFGESLPVIWPEYARCQVVAVGRHEAGLWLAPLGGEHVPLLSLPEYTFIGGLTVSAVTTVSFHARRNQRLVHLGDKPTLVFS